MKFKNFDRIMGVALEADAAMLKTRYRTLALKWHPEMSKSANTKLRFTGRVACGMDVPRHADFAETNLQWQQVADGLHRCLGLVEQGLALVLELFDECDLQRVTLSSQSRMNP